MLIVAFSSHMHSLVQDAQTNVTPTDVQMMSARNIREPLSGKQLLPLTLYAPGIPGDTSVDSSRLDHNYR